MTQLLTYAGDNVPSKEEIKNAVSVLNDRYNNGGLDVNPVRDYVLLKAMEAFIKDALEIAKPWAMQGLAGYSDQERKCLYGAQVSMVTGKAEYDYSQCAEVIEKEQVVKDLKASAKDEERQLKALQEKAIKEQRAVYVGQEMDNISVKLF